jgi:hypothetical protein
LATDAREEFFALCEKNRVNPIDFDNSCCQAVDDHFDIEDADIWGTIKALRDGQDIAVPASYWGWLSDQLLDMLHDLELRRFEATAIPM